MQFLINRFTYYSILLFFLTYACAQTPEHTPEEKPAVSLKDLEREITQLANDPLLKTGNFAFSIKSAQTGQTLLAHNTNKSLLIASNLKIVTTATALAMLGEDYTFITQLQHDGSLDANGVLNGNLYIKGGGDPTLGSARVKGSLNLTELMDFWANQIRGSGIKQINGAVIGDADIYNENVIPGSWVWSDIGNYYGAGAYGLNINENLYQLYFKPGKVGSPALILRTEPLMKGVIFANEVTTGPVGSGDNAYIYGAPYTNLRYVQGTVPAGVQTFSIRGAIPDPVTFTAEMLSQTLTKQGIRVKNPATSTRLMRQQKKSVKAGRDSLYTHFSPPLKYIVEQTNLQSINLYAEAILKVLALQEFKDGTTFSGTEAVVNFWKENNINTDGFFMRDGSGLSRTNVITASTLNEILHWCTDKPFFPSLLASLPVAGVSGTMRNTGRGTPAAGNVFAKTGTVERVMSYAGYFRTKSGELLSFVIITNDYNGEGTAVKRRVEKLMSLMVQLP